MSYEILAMDQYPRDYSCVAFRVRSDTGAPVHSVVHDLESFSWVFVVLCLTRKGPGGHRRNEFIRGTEALDAEAEQKASRLRGVVSALFDAGEAEVKNSKYELFRTPREFESIIQPFFHPYFNRVKGLLLKWWNLLQLTYSLYDEVAQGTLHDQVLALLDEELQDAAKWSTEEEDAIRWLWPK